MQEGIWTEYGTPGTPTLTHDDVEDAVAHLERFWTDALTWARLYTATYGECPRTDPLRATEPAA